MTDPNHTADSGNAQPHEAEARRLKRLKEKGGPILSDAPEVARQAEEQAQKIDDSRDEWLGNLIEKSRRPDGTIPGDEEQVRVREQYRGWAQDGTDADKKEPKGAIR